MQSKNMADYTNFQGKTNKKIIYPPGGASSFSLGWGNDPIDYGPARTTKKAVSPLEQNPKNLVTQNKGLPSYERSIMVMTEETQVRRTTQQSQGYNGNFQTKQPFQNNKTPNTRYTAYYAQNQKQFQVKKIKTQQEETETEQDGYGKNSISKAPSSNGSDHRPCIKFVNQKPCFEIGDSSYNYWKQTQNMTGKKNPTQKGGNGYEKPQLPASKQTYQQKTSVKVNNPAGGKSSFIFG